MPQIPFQSVSWGADSQSILFVGQSFGIWHIYRFRLDTHELIQLTDHLSNKSPQEWNPRLSAPLQQKLLPVHWGEIKSN